MAQKPLNRIVSQSSPEAQSLSPSSVTSFVPSKAIVPKSWKEIAQAHSNEDRIAFPVRRVNPVDRYHLDTIEAVYLIYAHIERTYPQIPPSIIAYYYALAEYYKTSSLAEALAADELNRIAPPLDAYLNATLADVLFVDSDILDRGARAAINILNFYPYQSYLLLKSRMGTQKLKEWKALYVQTNLAEQPTVVAQVSPILKKLRADERERIERVARAKATLGERRPLATYVHDSFTLHEVSRRTRPRNATPGGFLSRSTLALYRTVLAQYRSQILLQTIPTIMGIFVIDAVGAEFTTSYVISNTALGPHPPHSLVRPLPLPLLQTGLSRARDPIKTIHMFLEILTNGANTFKLFRQMLRNQSNRRLLVYEESQHLRTQALQYTEQIRRILDEIGRINPELGAVLTQYLIPTTSLEHLDPVLVRLGSYDPVHSTFARWQQVRYSNLDPSAPPASVSIPLNAYFGSRLGPDHVPLEQQAIFEAIAPQDTLRHEGSLDIFHLPGSSPSSPPENAFESKDPPSNEEQDEDEDKDEDDEEEQATSRPIKIGDEELTWILSQIDPPPRDSREDSQASLQAQARLQSQPPRNELRSSNLKSSNLQPDPNAQDLRAWTNYADKSIGSIGDDDLPTPVLRPRSPTPPPVPVPFPFPDLLEDTTPHPAQESEVGPQIQLPSSTSSSPSQKNLERTRGVFDQGQPLPLPLHPQLDPIEIDLDSEIVIPIPDPPPIPHPRRKQWADRYVDEINTPPGPIWPPDWEWESQTSQPASSSSSFHSNPRSKPWPSSSSHALQSEDLGLGSNTQMMRSQESRNEVRGRLDFVEGIPEHVLVDDQAVLLANLSNDQLTQAEQIRLVESDIETLEDENQIEEEATIELSLDQTAFIERVRANPLQSTYGYLMSNPNQNSPQVPDRVIYLAGEAGTGKTFVLRRLIRTLQEEEIPVLVVAPTSLSAALLGGTTIHSAFGLGIADGTVAMTLVLQRALHRVLHVRVLYPLVYAELYKYVIEIGRLTRSPIGDQESTLWDTRVVDRLLQDPQATVTKEGQNKYEEELPRMELEMGMEMGMEIEPEANRPELSFGESIGQAQRKEQQVLGPGIEDQSKKEGSVVISRRYELLDQDTRRVLNTILDQGKSKELLVATSPEGKWLLETLGLRKNAQQTNLLYVVLEQIVLEERLREHRRPTKADEEILQVLSRILISPQRQDQRIDYAKQIPASVLITGKGNPPWTWVEKLDRILLSTEYLIVDEVSMVSAELLTTMDILMRLTRLYWGKNRTMKALGTSPFGGAVVIATGDLAQLPPINSTRVYKAEIWNAFTLHELTTQHRQVEGDELGRILHAIRTNRPKSRQWAAEKINRIAKPNKEHQGAYLSGTILLAARKDQVTEHNALMRRKLENTNATVLGIQYQRLHSATVSVLVSKGAIINSRPVNALETVVSGSRVVIVRKFPALEAEEVPIRSIPDLLEASRANKRYESEKDIRDLVEVTEELDLQKVIRKDPGSIVYHAAWEKDSARIMTYNGMQGKYLGTVAVPVADGIWGLEAVVERIRKSVGMTEQTNLMLEQMVHFVNVELNRIAQDVFRERFGVERRAKMDRSEGSERTYLSWNAKQKEVVLSEEKIWVAAVQVMVATSTGDLEAKTIVVPYIVEAPMRRIRGGLLELKKIVLRIPMLTAWAMTIHKAQGMTLKEAVLDLNVLFEAGQAYVALSRLTSIEGLRIVQNGLINANMLRIDSEAIRVMNRLRMQSRQLGAQDRNAFLMRQEELFVREIEKEVDEWNRQARNRIVEERRQAREEAQKRARSIRERTGFNKEDVQDVRKRSEPEGVGAARLQVAGRRVRWQPQRQEQKGTAHFQIDIGEYYAREAEQEALRRQQGRREEGKDQ